MSDPWSNYLCCHVDRDIDIEGGIKDENEF